MSAVWLWVRAEWRRRLGSLAAVALLIAISGGAVLAAIAGARRTDTAFTRGAAATAEPNIEVLTPDFVSTLPDDAFERIVADPDVTSAYAFVLLGLAPQPSENFFSVGIAERAGDSGDDDVFIIDGRNLDLAAADEIVVNEAMADQLGKGPGDQVALWSKTDEQFLIEVFNESRAIDEQVDPGPPAGPRPTVTIVGVFRGIEDVSDNPDPFLAVGPGFLEAYGPDMWRCECGIRVRARPAARDAVIERLRASFGDSAIVQPSEDFEARVADAIGLQVGVLGVAALACAIAGSVVVIQALARQMALAAAERDARRALGITRRQEAGAGLALVAPVLALGAVGAVGTAWLASAALPVGLAGRAEPYPGREFDGSVLVTGATVLLAGVVVVSIVVASWTARARGPRRQATASPARSSRWLARLAGGTPARVVGLNLGARRSSGGSGSPIRAGVVGLALGIVGVIAVGLVDGSIDQVLATPRLYGADFDATIQNELGSVLDIEAIVADPRFDAVTAARDATAQENGYGTTLAGPSGEATVEVDPTVFEAYKGSIAPVLLEGRAPSGPAEIALGPDLLDAVGAGIGSPVTLTNIGVVEAVVVGVVVSPGNDHSARGLVLDGPGADLLVGGNLDVSSVLVRLGPDARDEETLQALADEYPGFSADREPPANVENLRELGGVPTALAIFLAALGAAALVYSMHTATRQRRRELAIHRALGVSRAQLSRALVWQAALVAALALAIGLPVGLVAARIVVYNLAERVTVVPSIAYPSWVWLAVPGAFALAGLAAARPLHDVRRLRPADVLRAE